MKNVCVILLIMLYVAISTIAQEVPYRKEDTYRLELSMEYRKVPIQNVNTVTPGRTTIVKNTGFDFYLQIKLNIIEILENDYRIKITNNSNDLILSKRLKSPKEYVIDIGRSSQIKKGKAPDKYTIRFIDSNKSTKSIITFRFTKTGVFYVNEVQFGQI